MKFTFYVSHYVSGWLAFLQSACLVFIKDFFRCILIPVLITSSHRSQQVSVLFKFFEDNTVMTVLGVLGESRDYPLLRSLPLCNQRAHVVEHGSVQTDGRPTHKGTLHDLMMHVSPLLVYVLSTTHVKERVTSTEGRSVPYSCTSSQMAQTGNNVLKVYDRIAHN